MGASVFEKNISQTFYLKENLEAEKIIFNARTLHCVQDGGQQAS